MLLIGAPLAASAAGLVLLDKDYSASVDLTLPASDGADSSDAPDAHAMLLGYAWSFAREQRGVEDPIRCEVLPGGGPQQARVVLHAPSQRDCTALAARFTDGLQQRWQAHLQAAQVRQAALQLNATQRLKRLQETLAAIGPGTAADQAGADASPLDALAAACTREHDHWSTYVQLRDRLVEAQHRRAALEEAPPVKNAVVDPAARASAYAAHLALQEDMRHLEIQLFQLRSSMLAIGEAARDSLNRLLEATADIGRLTDSAAALNSSPTARPLLEQTSEKAEEYHHHATLFAQEWSREYLGLQEMSPNPQTAETLDCYDRLVRRVRDFQQASDEAMATLRRRVRTLSEQASDTPATHTVDATIASRFNDLQNAYRDFEQAAQDLYARDNYLLSAALESARGLWYRTESMRREVDGSLEERALRRAVAERNERIAALTEELDRLRSEVLVVTDTIMAGHEDTARIAEHLPSYLAAASTAETAQVRRMLLQEQIQELEAELARETRVAAVPAQIAVTGTRIAGVPENLGQVLGGGGLAGCLTLLAALGVLRLARR